MSRMGPCHSLTVHCKVNEDFKFEASVQLWSFTMTVTEDFTPGRLLLEIRSSRKVKRAYYIGAMHSGPELLHLKERTKWVIVSKSPAFKCLLEWKAEVLLHILTVWKVKVFITTFKVSHYMCYHVCSILRLQLVEVELILTTLYSAWFHFHSSLTKLRRVRGRWEGNRT